MRSPRRRKSNERLDALLRDIASVRLTLDTDLTVAAAAADADRFDVAAEIVDFDTAELEAFADRALARLHLAEPQPVAESAERMAPAGPPKAATRRRFAFMAAPAMLAAAAIVAVVGITGQGPQAGVSRPQLEASYSALTALARSNTDPAKLVAIGQELNDSLAELIAAAAHDPAMAQQALRILEAEQLLLTRHHPYGGDTLLAQARALVRQLQQAVPGSVLRLAPPAPNGAVSPPGVLTVVVPTDAATQPAQGPAPAQTPAPATHSPASQPTAAAPTPEPTTGAATVNPQPSPQPSAIDPWPFGDTGFGGN